MAPDAAQKTRDDISGAALKCFRKWGVRKTTMADIADEASMLRPHLYRYFKNKDALIVSTLVDAARELSSRRLKTFKLEGPTDALLLDALMLGQKRLFADEFLGGIIAYDGANLVIGLLMEDPDFMDVQRAWWKPALDHGRSRGELRDDLDDADIIRWFLFSQVAIRERASMFAEDQAVRDHLERFVVPAVVRW